MHLNRFEKFFLAVISALVFLLSLSCAKEGTGAAGCTPVADSAIADITFVAFDTETTGLSPDANRIVEIGAVKFKAGKIIGKQQWLVNPGEHIPFFASNVHGIDDAMVADEPSFAEVYRDFLEFVGDSVLIAHNSRFDRDFMQAEMKRAGIDSPNLPLLDSLKLFRRLVPDSPSHSIGALVEYYDIEAENFHRALIDSVYIVKIMDKAISGDWEKIDYGTLLEYNNGPDHL